ncbi:MAG: chromosome partitioning protein ParB, partial [Firmicutes bacterium]|nr:chromosome partitioning protein ParB [Bacillota bacterium]
GIGDEQKVITMAREIVDKKINVRQVEERVAAVKRKKEKSARAEEDLFVRELREEMQKHLGTKVKINEGAKTGSILIEFYGYDDLQRLAELILGMKQKGF